MRNPQALQALQQQGACDLSYSLPERSRFRVNVFRQRGSFAIVMRVIASKIPTLGELNLPAASKHEKDPPRKANYVTVDNHGTMFLNKKQVDLPQLQEELVQLRMDDPDLSVIVRGDGKVKYKNIRSVLEVLQNVNVVKVDLATEAADQAKAQK